MFDNKIKEIDKRNEKIWCSDISEVKYDKGKLFVSGIIDVNTKAVMLELGERQDSKLTVKNLERALNKIGKPRYYHTDRGSVYCSSEMRDYLNRVNIEHSMSAPHRPNENQYIESFWKTMKTEIGNTHNMSKEDLKMAIKYYEYYYNYKRLHSSIGYSYPMEYLKQSRMIACH